MLNKVKIGTRGSPLALWQAREVERLLKEHFPALEIEIVKIVTSGEWKPSEGETRLSEAEGGKGLFAKEIEQALLAGEVDIGVHSMKDMDSFLPQGLVIDHMLPREDVRDVMLLRGGLRGQVKSFADFPAGARIGSASVRRAAFLLLQRPDVQIEPFRGNVQTRIDKVRGGQVDATFLALAGLKRLGLSHEADVILSAQEMLPAAGQGAVGIEMREGEGKIAEMLEAISCEQTVLCVKAERAALAALDGSCRSPIGAYARLEDEEMVLRLQVAREDGQKSWESSGSAIVRAVEAAEGLGQALAEALLPDIPAGILS